MQTLKLFVCLAITSARVAVQGKLISKTDLDHSLCNEQAPDFHFTPALDHPSRHGGSSCDVVVLTTLFGDLDSVTPYDENQLLALSESEALSGNKSCWFAFVDSVQEQIALNGTNVTVNEDQSSFSKVGVWNLVILGPEKLPFSEEEMAQNSRVPKMLGHLGFEFATYMVYLDAKVKLHQLEGMWDFIDEEAVAPKASWVSPRHPRRKSIYEEARCVYLVGLVDGYENSIVSQMQHYGSLGYPSAEMGLIEGNWHIRDLRDARSGALGCLWFSEFVKWGHKRDQLSFNFALWSMGNDVKGQGDPVPLEGSAQPEWFRYANSEKTAVSRKLIYLTDHKVKPQKTTEPSKPRPNSKICVEEVRNVPIAASIEALLCRPWRHLRLSYVSWATPG